MLKMNLNSLFIAGLIVAGISTVAADTSDTSTSGEGISELRVGFLKHDAGLFGSSLEDGVDANLEVLFASPNLLNAIGSPRPMVGISIHSEGETSQAYLGLDWQWQFQHGLFADLGLGAAFHNGETDSGDPNRKALGCSLLIKGAATLGYRFDRHHSLMLYLDHVSNAGLCDPNDGLDSVGLRYGYRF